MSILIFWSFCKPRTLLRLLLSYNRRKEWPKERKLIFFVVKIDNLEGFIGCITRDLSPFPGCELEVYFTSSFLYTTTSINVKGDVPRNLMTEDVWRRGLIRLLISGFPQSLTTHRRKNNCYLSFVQGTSNWFLFRLGVENWS